MKSKLFLVGMYMNIVYVWPSTTHWVEKTRIPCIQSIESFDFDLLADNRLRPLVYTENAMKSRIFGSKKVFIWWINAFDIVEIYASAFIQVFCVTTYCLCGCNKCHTTYSLSSGIKLSIIIHFNRNKQTEIELYDWFFTICAINSNFFTLTL